MIAPGSARKISAIGGTDKPSNAIILANSSRQLFTQLEIYFEARYSGIGTDEHDSRDYEGHINNLYSIHFPHLTRRPLSKYLNTAPATDNEDNDNDIAMPDPDFFKIHRALVRIAVACDANYYLFKVHENLPGWRAVDGDGSTPLDAIISRQLRIKFPHDPRKSKGVSEA